MLLSISPRRAYGPHDGVMAAALVDSSVPVYSVVRASAVWSELIVLSIHSQVMDGDVLMPISPLRDIFTGNLINDLVAHVFLQIKKGELSPS